MPLDPTRSASLHDQLHKLGLSEIEVGIYMSLLSGPQASKDLSHNLGHSSGRIREAVTGLARRGFVRRLPGRSARYALISPNRALSAMARRMDQDLRDLQQLSDHLTQLFEASSADSRSGGEGHYVEIVFGVDAVLSRLDEEVNAAETEVAVFSKAPLLAPGNPTEEQSLQEGVRHRSIYERDVLKDPMVWEQTLQFMREGEDARVVSYLPAKMVVIDRKLAIMNVTERTPAEPMVAGLVTRHPEVVDTLYMFFETLWEHALPLGIELEPDDREGRNELLACLLSGMTDEAIAGQLRISRRTVSRRVQSLLDDLDVGTRFQAGFKVAERLSSQPKDD